MFNGIIFNTGKVKKKRVSSSGLILTIDSKININPKKEIGSSICCSGVCLTLIKYKSNNLSFYVSSCEVRSMCMCIYFVTYFTSKREHQTLKNVPL